jgi:hypothetical protein
MPRPPPPGRPPPLHSPGPAHGPRSPWKSPPATDTQLLYGLGIVLFYGLGIVPQRPIRAPEVPVRPALPPGRPPPLQMITLFLCRGLAGPTGTSGALGRAYGKLGIGRRAYGNLGCHALPRPSAYLLCKGSHCSFAKDWQGLREPRVPGDCQGGGRPGWRGPAAAPDKQARGSCAGTSGSRIRCCCWSLMALEKALCD